MANIIDQRLKELNIELDVASVPAGSYVPYVITNNLVFISGQLPFINGELTLKGKIGDNISVEEGIQMAEACAMALLSQLKEACNGDLNKLMFCYRALPVKGRSGYPPHDELWSTMLKLMGLMVWC